MKFTASLLLLSSSLLPPVALAQNSDSEVAASWTQQGVCAYFFEKPGAWKSLAETCVDYCKNNGGHGYSECDYSAWKDFDLPKGIDQSLIGKDDSGDVYVPCKCKCDNPDVEGITNAILDIVIEGLSHLDEIICGVFMTAMVSVVEIGIDLIPGGAEATAAARGVQAVKSFTENALDVADSMGNWVGKACGIQDPNWPNSIFDVLLTSPDSFGTSIGCKKKNKADCKHVDSVPDKPKTKGGDDPVTKGPDPVTSAPHADPTTADAPPATSDAAPPPASSDAAPPATSDAPPASSDAPPASTDAPPASTDVPPVSTDTPPVSTDVQPTSVDPSATPSVDPSATPSVDPSATPSVDPSATPSVDPSATPSVDPSATSVDPSATPSIDPSATNSVDPSITSSVDPSATSGTATTSSSSATDSCGAGSTVVQRRGATQTAGAPACEATNACVITNPDVGGEDLNEDAINDVIDAVSDVTNILRLRGIDGHRSPRSLLQKRKPKSGNPCSGSPGNEAFVLQSDDYPSNGQLADDVKSWGYKLQNNLCKYEFQDGEKQITGNSYDSEHVMEWQTVTDFFKKLNAKGGKNYDHPDPNEPDGTKTDFCTYWIESWSLDASQEFSINGSAPYTPWNHIKTVYPGKTLGAAYKSEMIRLQKNINSTPKSNMFSDKVEYIWTKTDMDGLVKTNRNKVLERMRLLLGARTYLVDTKVKDIFKAQKERMGAMFDQLDTDMQTHTRTATVTDPVTGKTSTESYRPWVKQNLLTEWNTYMDQKWTDATAKHAKVMNYFINELDDKHCQSRNKQTQADKDFCTNLRTLQTNYRTATVFSQPW